MNINNNKGMYIEQLVDRTVQYFYFNNIGMIEKRQIPIKVLKHINETTIIAKLISKAKVDYFGFIDGKYIEIECKQTVHDYFDIHLIKPHQLNYLKENSMKQNCLSYILIYFERYDSILAISYDQLMECKNIAKKNALPYDLMVEHSIKLDITYPGILNLNKLK